MSFVKVARASAPLTRTSRAYNTAASLTRTSRAYNTAASLTHPAWSILTSSSSSAAASPSLSSSSLTASAPTSEITTPSILHRLGNSITEWFPSVVWAAVPKSKTSHSKKRMRQATKGLKEQHNIVQCPGCGQAKLMHHLCTHCYRDMKGRGGPNSGARSDEV